MGLLDSSTTRIKHASFITLISTRFAFQNVALLLALFSESYKLQIKVMESKSPVRGLAYGAIASMLAEVGTLTYV
jgi:hypothetical protein